jgi:hypothetical protein
MDRSFASRRPALLIYGLLGACTATAPSQILDPDASGALEAPQAGQDASAAPASRDAGVARAFLRVEDSTPAPIVLDLDKRSALELFGASAAKEITLLEIDSTLLLENALGLIQSACGDGWKNGSSDPGHDCASTALGRTFGPSWQTSPEFAVVRMLGMTPANAVVRGTSLADFASLIDGNPDTFKFTFAEVLAGSLGIARTDPFVPVDALARSLQLYVLGTHPAIADPSGAIAISMYDALKDMEPLAAKLGPVGQAPWSGPGEHPGVLLPDDASFTTRSDALGPNFRMRVVASSNLRRVLGVDMSRGAGDMFLLEGDSPLAFDFNDPAKLQITGITESPTVDLRMSLREVAGKVASCVDVPACKSNLPSTPVAGSVWTLSPWLLEPIIARSGLIAYEHREFSRCYVTFSGQCQTGVQIGQATDPAGWTAFFNHLSFSGTPIHVPPPQFLWELLTDVAQVALHDPNGDGTPDLPEGGVAPTFALRGVPLGITGTSLIAQIRPSLQRQAGKLADLVLGRYWKNNAPLDFFYRRAAPSGAPVLYFVAASDPRADPANPASLLPYRYKRPGFFAAPDLSEASRVSSKTLDGVDETDHEKFRLPAGTTTLYLQDDEDRVYEVVFHVPATDASEIVVDVRGIR